MSVAESSTPGTAATLPNARKGEERRVDWRGPPHDGAAVAPRLVSKVWVRLEAIRRDGGRGKEFVAMKGDIPRARRVGTVHGTVLPNEDSGLRPRGLPSIKAAKGVAPSADRMAG